MVLFFWVNAFDLNTYNSADLLQLRIILYERHLNLLNAETFTWLSVLEESIATL